MKWACFTVGMNWPVRVEPWEIRVIADDVFEALRKTRGGEQAVLDVTPNWARRALDAMLGNVLFNEKPEARFRFRPCTECMAYDRKRRVFVPTMNWTECPLCGGAQTIVVV